ncbi:MAG: hypothetical protein K2R98_07610 [Gemmataceae bacterium]|nr:hypothetical protein [Gemmataceae bacterium]
MFPIPLPWPLRNWELLLSFRWTELPPPAVVGVVLLCLLPPVLVVCLYIYEMRLVRTSTAVMLLGLRLFVLAFLVFIAMLQPILRRTTTEELPGRVMVAVDRSDSIDVTDPQRPPVEKLRLARALKIGGDICPESQLDAWIKQYQDKGQLQLVAADEFPDDPTRRRQLGEQRRAQHDLVCRRIDELTRTQVAERVLDKSGVGLLPAITAKHGVELNGFAQELWDVKPDQVNELFQKRSAIGSATDLRLPLIRALERSTVDESKLVGIVVFTDGQHNWGPSPVAKAAELGDHRLPIYPVALGSRQAPPSIAIASIKSPPAVFKDVDADVHARVQVTGLPAQEITVELTRPGQDPLKETIKHDGTDRVYLVPFQVRLEKVGTQTLTMTAKQQPGEVRPTTKVRTENSSRPVVINVADDKAKVLLIDGEARYEFHYLASALTRDRTMQVKKVVFDQPRLGKLPEAELEKLGNPSRQLPVEPEALAGYDCIVLGDVSPAQLPLSDRVRLEKYVADRGGTLVMLAGKRYMPMAYAKDYNPASEQMDPLLKLLPIVNERPFDAHDGFQVTLTDEGKRVPFLQMEATPDKSRERWAALPPHFWAVIGEAKPGAVALASFTREDRGRKPIGLDTEPLVPNKPATANDPSDKRCLIARQNYGFGRVLYVGIDSTWRWRFKVGDTYHHKFWGQVIRWAASDKPLITGNDMVRFGTRDPVYQQGQEVDVIVRLSDDVTPPRPDSLAAARIVRADDKNGSEDAVALVPLTPQQAQPRLLEGRVRDLPPGKYNIELAIPELADKLMGAAGSDGQPMKFKAPFTITPRDNSEMIDLATNWPLLEEIASKSGGKVFTPETAHELGELLNSQVVTRTVPVERKLWQEWLTLVLFLGLLTAEWVGRKMAGLP